MKTKQQILQAIKQCQKMTLKSEQDCCSKCPYKKKSNCYTLLLKDVKRIIEADRVRDFVKYLKDNHDGSILNEDGTEPVMDIIDVATLDKKYKEFRK